MTDTYAGAVEHTHEDFEDEDFSGPEVLEFDELAENAVSRRRFMGGALGCGLSAMVLGGTALSPASAKAAGRIAFDPVATNGLDTVTVPKGYSWHVVMSWGDPLWSNVPEFDDATRGNAASQALAVGDNTDGMYLFTHQGRSILASNNEYINRKIIFGNREGGKPVNADDVRKGKAAHGVTVCEIVEKGGKWSIVKDSMYNRRITPDTPMDITGPARGHDMMKTVADPTGTKSLGTWNNCGNGQTPWGTYLTCEENFHGYFSSSDKGFAIPANMKRYGIKHDDRGYAWASDDERFDISKHPNEPNRAGYIVEIDPFDAKSTPKKRTALGRFKHENAELVVATNGHVVVYMGDDERGEFLYRFVSAKPMTEGGDNSNLLEDGTLYVAKFTDNGRGEWIALTPETTGMASQGEICINTRIAASIVGATTMDRPEWVACSPVKAEAYCALTNNKNRGVKPNAGGDATPVGGPNPRKANNYGQIVRWAPDNDDHTAPQFGWDLYVVAGNPTVHEDAYAGSPNVTKYNMFNSPDGLKFDTTGLLWIQTDGKYTNKGDFAGHGNNQMLVGDPMTGEIHRFMVGPKECEITGLTWSADRRTMFVGIQHPGEKGDSHFPGGGDSVPRSAIVAVTRDDGQKIG